MSFREDMIKKKYRLLLNETDWKVIRHRDQLEQDIDTSMTAGEYQNLLSERQSLRNTCDEEIEG